MLDKSCWVFLRNPRLEGCDLKKHKCSLENVFWQKIQHILQITNCTQFSVSAAWFFVLKLLISSTVTIQRNVFHAKRKVAVASIWRVLKCSAFHGYFLCHAPLFSFLLLTDVSDMSPDLTRPCVKKVQKFWCSFNSELHNKIKSNVVISQTYKSSPSAQGTSAIVTCLEFSCCLCHCLKFQKDCRNRGVCSFSFRICWSSCWWLEVQSTGIYLLCFVFDKMFWPWRVQPRALLYPSFHNTNVNKT